MVVLLLVSYNVKSVWKEQLEKKPDFYLQVEAFEIVLSKKSAYIFLMVGTRGHHALMNTKESLCMLGFLSNGLLEIQFYRSGRQENDVVTFLAISINV